MKGGRHEQAAVFGDGGDDHYLPLVSGGVGMFVAEQIAEVRYGNTRTWAYPCRVCIYWKQLDKRGWGECTKLESGSRITHAGDTCDDHAE